MLLKDKKGIMLIACYLVIVVLSVLASAFLIRSVGEKRIADRERDTMNAFYAAEAGIDDVIRDLFDNFQNSNPNPSSGDFVWFDALDDPGPPYVPPVNDAGLGGGRTYTVTIPAVTVDLNIGQADVTLESTGSVNNISRTVRCVIRYTLATSEVFNYSYFVNNLGWFWGGGIEANGDIRSSGDFSFNGNPTVNGDIYASVNPALGVDGDITGNSRNDTINFYRDNADDEARPTNPTADPDPPNDYSYADGYDGDSERFPNQPPVEMPYLGDLQTYRDLAAAEGGTITQGGEVLVNAVYGDDPTELGPDGEAGTADDGCVVLVGTAANPIVINGPVVVEEDVIIRGEVQGQGIIYSGRNTHIIGDINYVNPPAWPKPDTDPEGTDAVNDARDFLGLAAKGSVVVGDYTRNDWQTSVEDYIQPPFTQAYIVDPTDEDYITGYDGDGNPVFHGDYTDTYGVKEGEGARPDQPRKYYESSFRNSFIRSIAVPSNQIRRVDAVAYTNHAFAGRVGAFTINGNVVSRDEAIVYSGSITMNHDIRAKNRGENFHLPGELAQPQMISWREN